MTQEEFIRLAQQRGYKAMANGAFGAHAGYPFSAVFQPQLGGSITVTFQVEGKVPGALLRSVRKALPKGCTLMNPQAGRLVLSCTGKKGDLSENFTASMDAVTAHLREAGLTARETCAICGSAGCDASALVGGAYQRVHRSCVEHRTAGQMAAAEQSMASGNYLTGFLGAILGGLVGSIPAVLCLNFLNYYVAILYALIPLAANYGYRLFKGKANKAGFVFTLLSSILNLFTVEFLSIYIQLALYRHSLPTIGYAFEEFMWYVEQGSFAGSAIMDVVFLALGLWMAWNQIKRTGKHVISDSQAVLASMMPDDGSEVAAPAPASSYTMVQPEDAPAGPEA